MSSFSFRPENWKSLVATFIIAFSIWLSAFVPTVFELRRLAGMPRSLDFHPYLAFFVLAFVTSLASLVTIVAILAEHRFFVRFSCVLLGLTGIIATLSIGIPFPPRRLFDLVFGNMLLIGALLCGLQLLRYRGYRLALSVRQNSTRSHQYPIRDLFILTAAIAVVAAAVRISGAGENTSVLRNVLYFLYLVELSVCFAITSLLVLAVVLGKSGWRRSTIVVLLAPIGYVPATTVRNMTLFAPWWCGALTASHTCLLVLLLLIFRIFGFRLIRIANNS